MTSADPDESAASDGDVSLAMAGGGYSSAASVVSIGVGLVMTCVGTVMLFSGTAITVPAVMFGVAFLYVGVRAGRLRVVADRNGLAVRNPWRSYQFAWRDIDDFDAINSSVFANRDFTTGEPGTVLTVTTWYPDARTTKLAASFLPGGASIAEQLDRVARLRSMRAAYSTHEG